MQRRGFLAATLASPGLALAQEWPTGPIRAIVPFAPGSATDTVARLFAERMRDTLGQPVVIENRAGASGLIGAETVARAPADGMTLLFGTNSTNAAANALFSRVPFDMERDFAPISTLASVPLLVRCRSLQANNYSLIGQAIVTPGLVGFRFESGGGRERETKK